MKKTLAKIRGKRWTLALEWKAADLWVGIYWHRHGPLLNAWVCLLPCLPIHIQWMRSAAALGPSPEMLAEATGSLLVTQAQREDFLRAFGAHKKRDPP